MTSRFVAGVDWAGGEWLAVTFRDGSYDGCILGEHFEDLRENNQELDLMLVDVPIGLPEDEETLAHRENLDSMARAITGRPSSVFPVPTREAAKEAYEGKVYEEVSEQNKDDIGKGLTRQSYHIAAGIGEVDALLCASEQARDVVVESHPEVCFRGLLGCQLQHSKQTAAGVGERLEAISKQLDKPGKTLKQITSDLAGVSDGVEIDDVVDAIALGVTATCADELSYLPEDPKNDEEGIPMRMAYWTDGTITPAE